MAETKNVDVDISAIRNILTLRYLPTKQTQFKKLTWEDFVEESTNNSTDFVENSLKNTIQKKILELKPKKVSIALSGGLDSTLTLALLNEQFPDLNIEAISVKFAESTDESEGASKIADYFNANHTIIPVENFFKELPKVISILKLPFWDLMNWYYVVKKSKTISQILFSGDGGDEIFGGYTFRYSKFLQSVNSNSSPLEKIKAYLNCHERDWVPDQEKIFGNNIKFSWDEIYDILKPYFDNPLNHLNQVFLSDFNGKLLFNWIPNYTKIHEHFGIKSISPFLTSDLISFVTHLSIKEKYDIKTNTGKLILRKILSNKLPENFPSKKKQGFSVNTINLWKLYGKEICDYYLSDARIVKDNLINPDWIKIHFEKLKENLDVRYINKFFSILALEIWYRLFITKEITSETNL